MKLSVQIKTTEQNKYIIMTKADTVQNMEVDHFVLNKTLGRTIINVEKL